MACSDSNLAQPDLAALAADPYIRERLQPRPGDPLYLHLSDLREALGGSLPAAGARILDYGCGGSPYRSLHPNPICYHRADYLGVPSTDYQFGPDSRISATDAFYDHVLSTQVLEHVGSPQSYLAECIRVLKPGGSLVLTTHGLYPDHACPHDFRRWTAEGIRLDLEGAGFQVERVEKLTTGPRAVLFMNRMAQSTLLVSRSDPAALALRIGRFIYSRLPAAAFDRMSDREYKHCRVVPSSLPGHDFYIAVHAVARRPA